MRPSNDLSGESPDSRGDATQSPRNRGADGSADSCAGPADPRDSHSPRSESATVESERARSARDLDVAIEALDNRMERDDFPFLLVIHQAKVQTLRAIRDGETDPVTVEVNTSKALRQDMDLLSFVKVQSARNAAAWAGDHSDFDRI